MQYLAKEFVAQNGSCICRELADLSETNTPPPITREDGRGCKNFVADFAKTIAEYIEKNRPEADL